MKKQAKLTVYLGVVNDNKEVLIYTRKKSPFYDCQGFGGGRVEYGEDIVDAAKRELKEETGLDGDSELIKILHNKLYAKDTKELVVDKILFYFKISNPTGTLISTDEGFYEWVKIDNISEYIVKPFDSKDEFLRQVEYLVNWDGKITLEEQSQEVEDY
jgi:8-oxo-dGTP pyrophosphatase MutT (NUDIX family)